MVDRLRWSPGHTRRPQGGWYDADTGAPLPHGLPTTVPTHRAAPFHRLGRELAAFDEAGLDRIRALSPDDRAHRPIGRGPCGDGRRRGEAADVPHSSLGGVPVRAMEPGRMLRPLGAWFFH